MTVIFLAIVTRSASFRYLLSFYNKKVAGKGRGGP